MPRKTTPSPTIPEDLLDLRHRLEQWRSSHPPRSRLPEQFWLEAVELARKHGRSRTALALPVHYPTLCKRMSGTDRPKATGRPAKFVELVVPPPATAVVELMRVPVHPGLDWQALLRAWRQAGQ